MENNQTKTATIGIVLPHLNFRGTEKQSLNICKGLQEQGFKVVLFNIQGWGYFSEVLIESGVEVVNVGPPIHEGKKGASKIRLFKLAYLAKKYKCNCLLCRGATASQVCAFAAKISRIPSIIVFSNRIKKPNLNIKKSSFRKKVKLLRFLLKRGFANYYVTVSLEGTDNLLSTFPSLSGRVFPIQNGVNIDDIYKKLASSPKIKKPDRFRLCFAGSLELKRKGLDTLIDAMHDLVNKKNKTDIELLLIGSGGDEAALKKRVEEKGLEKSVVFAGEQKNPYYLVKSSDLFILPSRHEGFPNALLEAMALGVCSIAFDCQTGPKEIITNNKNGILLSSNTTEELADSVIRLKKDTNLRKRLALKGKQTIQEKFTYQKMMSGYIKLLKKVLDIE